MEPNIDALIARMEQSRARLNAALDKIAPQAEIYPSWKLKQVLDHITGWDELVVSTLHAYQRGDTPARSVKSIDQYNLTSVADRHALSLEQSRQAYTAARQEVLQTLRSLTGELLTRRYKAPWGGNCTIASIVKIFVSHEQEHAKQIEQLLNKSSAV
jgi:hypothetical protein